MIAELEMPTMPWLFVNAGFDSFIIDMEHGSFGIDRIAGVSKVGRLAKIAGIRVRDNDCAFIARSLEAGAVGVMISRVRAADDVARAISAARYHPPGQRGFAGRRAHSDCAGGVIFSIAHERNPHLINNPAFLWAN